MGRLPGEGRPGGRGWLRHHHLFLRKEGKGAAMYGAVSGYDELVVSFPAAEQPDHRKIRQIGLTEPTVHLSACLSHPLSTALTEVSRNLFRKDPKLVR